MIAGHIKTITISATKNRNDKESALPPNASGNVAAQICTILWKTNLAPMKHHITRFQLAGEACYQLSNMIPYTTSGGNRWA